MTAITVLFLYLLLPRTPAYQGKPLEAWLDQFGTNLFATQGPRGELEKEAGDAIRHIGTNAVPIYLNMLTAKESPVKMNLLSKLQRPWLTWLHLPSVSDYQNNLGNRRRLGTDGLVALGEMARPAVPALIALISDKNSDIRYLAVFTLRALGPVASEALPNMIECLKDRDDTIRDDAATALGTIHQEPARVVPILIAFLEKYRNDRIHSFPSYSAIRALHSFGPDAKQSVPILISFLNDPELAIRMETTNALLKIDPEAAAKAGVKPPQPE